MTEADTEGSARLSWVGRLALACLARPRTVMVVWRVLAGALGSQFPRLHSTLSGAGWDALGSDSVEVRDARSDRFPVAVLLLDPGGGQKRCRSDEGARRGGAQGCRRTEGRPGDRPHRHAPTVRSRLTDGRTAIVAGTATASTAEMVRAADRLRDRLGDIRVPGARVLRTGLPAQWADFNKNHAHQAERAEAFALPVTLVILVIAFGSLTAAGLPLLLTVLGLAISGGILVAIAHLTELSSGRRTSRRSSRWRSESITRCSS